MLSNLDSAIAEGKDAFYYTHQVKSGATGIHTDDTEYTNFIAGVKARENLGLVDVITVSEWYALATGDR